MTIRLLFPERIAVDGVHVKWYRQGDILHVSLALAEALIRDGIATAELKPDSKEQEETLLKETQSTFKIS